MKRAIAVAAVIACSLHALIGAQQVGVNVNVLSGTEERTGDAFAQRQNEAVVAISTRNNDHIMVAMNDYRTVDVAFDPTAEEGGPNGVMARRLGAKAQAIVAQAPPEAWVGLAFSRDRGRSWYTGLLPGYPQDPTDVGKASPVYGDSAGSDPVLITGKSGRVYLVALTFDRGGVSRISSTRYTDRNNVEGGEPFYFDFTKQIDRGSLASKGRFADKPSGAAYAGDNSGVSTGGASNRRRGVTVTAGCERVYTAYTVFQGNDATGNFRNSVMLSLSADCGVSWSAPAKISGPYSVGGVNYPGTRNQGTTMAVDPDTGHVYVAWRTYEPNGFVFVKSIDGGLSFSAPRLLASGVTPYDQTLRTVNDGTNVTTFRSNSYPSMVVYAGEPVVAWQERVDANGNSSAAGEPRVVMTRGQNVNGVLVWSARVPADLGDVGASPGTRCEQEIPAGETTAVAICRPTGAQVMPSLSVRTGQLAIAYYESRHQDPDPQNGDAVGAPRGLAPATGEISGMHRQLDTRVALYNADTWVRTQSFQVSRYPIDPATGRIRENPSAPDPKLRRQVNYPNYPMYRGGLAAFVGDYLHSVPLRADGSSPGFRFVFTSNELVVPPPDLDFTKYSKPQQGVASSCNPGSRNSTIMTAEVGTGLVVGSPGTFKQLLNSANQPVQRAFAVYVENHTPAYRGFRMSVVPAAGVTASFEQFSVVTTVDVEVLASSSITRTVYLSGANPAGSATVNVTELQLQVAPDRPAVAPTLNLAASLILNGDSTNPPVGGVGGNPELANLETHTPQLGTPQLGTPQLGTAAVTSPQLGTPQLGTPQLGTPQLGTPQVSTPQLGTAGPSDPSITDITYTVTNEGNTASAFNSLISLANAPNLTGTGHTFQVLVYRVHQTAAVSGCDIAKAQQDQIVYMTPQLGTPQLGTPQLGTPQLGTPQLGTPQLGTPQLGTPQLGTTQLATASFSIAPGDPTPDDHDGTEHQHQADDELRLTIRVTHPHGEDVAAAHPDQVQEFGQAVSVTVEAQAVDTNDADGLPTRATTGPLEIVTGSVLPTAVFGSPYSTTLSGNGGLGPYSWAVVSGTAPQGLSLASTTRNAMISGTPTLVQTSTFTVRLSDSAGNSVQRAFSIEVTVPPGATLQFSQQPGGAPAGKRIAGPTTVRAVYTTPSGTAGIAGVPVTLALGANPTGATLLGTGAVTAVTDATGSMTYPNLSIDKPGAALPGSAAAGTYTLTAAGAGLPTVTSNAFTITAKRLLIYGDSFVEGEAGAVGTEEPNERSIAQAEGYTVDIRSSTSTLKWSAITAAEVATFNAVIIPDPNHHHNPSIAAGDLVAAEANRATWSAATAGPKLVVGTDPVYHQVFAGAEGLMRSGINFAASELETGLYLSLSTHYQGQTNVVVNVLDQFGVFRVTHVESSTATIAPAGVGHPALSGLTDALLSDWGSSVHEIFDAFPPTWRVLAIGGTTVSGPFILADR